MTVTTHVRTSVGAILLSALLGACASGAPATPTPAASGSPSSTPPSQATVSASPTAAPGATPSPAQAPTPSPSPLGCAFTPSKGALPSDRLVDVKVTSTADADVITFVFGHSSIPPNPAGKPTGDLTTARKPYTEAGSGKKIAMTGGHVLDLVFDHLSLQSDAGELTYDGPTEFKAAGPAFRHLYQYDAFEGHSNWYIGYDEPACVTLTRSGQDVIIAFAHS